MKVLRIIKWIAFVVCILSFAICAVGNTLVFIEANDTGEMVETIKASVQARNPISDIFGGSDADPAEGTPSEAKEPATSGEDNAGDATAGDATVGDATASEAAPEGGDQQPAQAPAQPDASKIDGAQTQPEGGYSPDHGNVALAFMKYGTSTTGVGLLSNTLGISGINPVAKCLAESSLLQSLDMSIGSAKLLNSYDFSDSPLGLQFKANTCLFIAFVSLLIAFIMHVITKRHKTVYGTILTVVAFLIFTGLCVIGYYFSDCIAWATYRHLLGNDILKYRIGFNAIVFAFAFVFCLPIYSCGIRQMKNRYLKNRLRRKRYQ